MVSKGRRAERDLRRRSPRLDPLPRVLVVVEGEVTEQEYFTAIRRQVRAALVVEVEGGGDDPKRLVERALDSKRRAERLSRREGDASQKFEHVWCVFDVDDHARLGDALQQARANGISVAVSNPCFELWLLLHFVDHWRFEDRHAIRNLVCMHVPGYDKSVDVSILQSGYPNAVARAVALRRRNAESGEPGKNPSTDVDVLAELLWAKGGVALQARRRGL